MTTKIRSIASALGVIAHAPDLFRKFAKLNGGVAPTYVAGLLEDLSDKPLDEYTAKLVEGVGHNFTRELAKVEDTEVLSAEPGDDAKVIKKTLQSVEMLAAAAYFMDPAGILGG